MCVLFVVCPAPGIAPKPLLMQLPPLSPQMGGPLAGSRSPARPPRPPRWSPRLPTPCSRRLPAQTIRWPCLTGRWGCPTAPIHAVCLPPPPREQTPPVRTPTFRCHLDKAYAYRFAVPSWAGATVPTLSENSGVPPPQPAQQPGRVRPQ